MLRNRACFVILLCWILVVCRGALAKGDFVYDSQGRRNPFAPLVSSDGRLLNFNKETLQELQVNGIIYDKQGSSYAIVNSMVVKSGDIIGEYKVLRIEENKVVFDKGGQPLEIEIHDEEAE
ncbi:MAG: general secretion pathway protein GspB [Candidatus Omnitrophota bacterium]